MAAAMQAEMVTVAKMGITSTPKIGESSELPADGPFDPIDVPMAPDPRSFICKLLVPLVDEVVNAYSASVVPASL